MPRADTFATIPAARARRFGRLALLLLLAWPAAGGGQAAPPDPMEARRLRYLEIELRQLGQVEKQNLGPMRLGAGVLGILVGGAALARGLRTS